MPIRKNIQKTQPKGQLHRVIRQKFTTTKQTKEMINSIKHNFIEMLSKPKKPNAECIDFDYVIPISNCNDKEYKFRLKAMQTLIEYLPSNVHLIIIEQVVNPNYKTYLSKLYLPERLKNTQLIVKHKTFNKAWLNNIGINNSKTNNVLFAESDMVIDEPYIEKLHQYILKIKPKWCVCWSNIIYWNKDEKTAKRVYNNSSIAQGGIIYFNKPFLRSKIGGFNELFSNLGGIDNEIYTRASTLQKPKKLNYVIHHMWHPTSPLKKKKTRLINKKLCRFTKTNAKFINHILVKEKNSLGNLKQPAYSLLSRKLSLNL